MNVVLAVFAPGLTSMRAGPLFCRFFFKVTVPTSGVPSLDPIFALDRYLKEKLCAKWVRLEHLFLGALEGADVLKGRSVGARWQSACNACFNVDAHIG